MRNRDKGNLKGDQFKDRTGHHRPDQLRLHKCFACKEKACSLISSVSFHD